MFSIKLAYVVKNGVDMNEKQISEPIRQFETLVNMDRSKDYLYAAWSDQYETEL